MPEPTHGRGCTCAPCVRNTYTTQSKPYTEQPKHPINTGRKGGK